MGNCGSEKKKLIPSTKNIFWVDKNIKNEENQKYCSQINNKYGITVEQFTQINSLFEKMKPIKYELIITIISGELIEDYLARFKKEQIVLCIIPIHIIFTNNKNNIINLLKKEYSEDLETCLINIEDIASNFKELQNLLDKYLEDLQTKINEGNLEKQTDYNDCFSYEYYEKSQQLESSLYQQIIENKKVSHLEISIFNFFLLKNFGEKEKRINELILPLIEEKKFSDEIIAECWAKVLTLKSSFYSSINCNLMQLKNEQYNTFVRILYSGLKKYSYKGNQHLFRGSIMENNEMKEIKEKCSKEGNSNNTQPKIFVCSKIYLFFSEIRDVAIKDIKKKKGYSSVLFEIEINRKNNSNANLSSFSFYPDRKEILFFPFSCFLIKDVCDDANQTKIILEYLGIYEKRIDEIICEYNIKTDKNKEKKNKKIQILNSYEEVKRKDPYRDWKNNKAIKNEKEIKENCEIYLNNKKKTFSYEYIFEKEDKNEIKIILKNSLKNTNFMFYECSSLTSLNLFNFKTKNVKDMSYMFYGCSSLTSLNLSNFNTNNVNNMSHMFYECSSLTALDLSNFNTNKVEDMSKMFYKCSTLKSLDLSKFTANNLLDMNEMFYKCSALTSLNLSNFKTNKVKDMSGVFSFCSTLESLDLSNFNNNNVKDMSAMFIGCSKLTSLTLSNFKTNNVEDMSKMFYKCSTLESLDLSHFNTENVKDMSYMFYECSSLNSLDLSNFNTNKVINMSRMFLSCSSLESLDLSKFTTNNVEDMSDMFNGCSKLTSLNLSNFTINNVEDMSRMFNGCSNLTFDNLKAKDEIKEKLNQN